MKRSVTEVDKQEESETPNAQVKSNIKIKKIPPKLRNTNVVPIVFPQLGKHLTSQVLSTHTKKGTFF